MLLTNAYRIIGTMNITCCFFEILFEESLPLSYFPIIWPIFSERCSVIGMIPITGPVLSPLRAKVLKIVERSISSGKIPSKALICKPMCSIFCFSQDLLDQGFFTFFFLPWLSPFLFFSTKSDFIRPL